MKQGTLTTRAVMILLFVTVAAYFGVSVWRSLDQRIHTFATYAYTLDDAAEATGLLVRQEELIQGKAAAVVDVLPGQGEKVGVGQTVAYLYKDESALERTRELRTLELEREQLVSAMKQGNISGDGARLDESIVDDMLSLRSAAAYGDLTGLEEQSLTFKSLVIRRGYSSGAAAEGMETMVASVDAKRDALLSSSAQDTTAVTVKQSGCFSSETDGYETLVTPDMLGTMTVSSLEGLMEQKPQAPEAVVGKLVTNSRWYFLASLPEATAQRLTKGSTIQVRFSRDWSGEVLMTVERVGAPEGGQCVTVLSANQSLADTILLRKQTVDLIFDSTDGIRVPKNAVRNQTVTVTDKNGTQTSVQRTGVYVLTGAQAEFKEVKILADDGDFYLASAVLPDIPSQQEEKTRFRAGDEVIISAEELFDGKVVMDS